MTSTGSVLVIATTNPGKVAEFRALLDPLLDLTRVTLAIPSDLGVTVPPVEETGATFAENAVLKALAFAQVTGHPALADDSGLCVDALGGAPGLHSARWAGANASDADRVTKLLQEMAGLPAMERTARFICAAAVAMPEGRVEVAEGVCEGIVLAAPRGTHGFGYDPIFLLPSLRQTMAELSPSEKNRLSHRALALQNLHPFLLTLLSSEKSG